MAFVDFIKSNPTVNGALSPGLHPSSWADASDDLLMGVLKFVNDGVQPVKRKGGGIYVPPVFGAKRRPHLLMDYLSDVTAIPFMFGYAKEIPTMEELRETVFLEPYLIRDLSGDVKTEILARASHDNLSGHFMNMENILFCLRAADKWQDNPILGRLKYYLMQYENGAKPSFFPTPDGVTVLHDALSGTRVLLALNAYHWHVQFSSMLDPRVLVEIFEYLFQSPFSNTKKLKSAIGNHRKAAFSKTTSGNAIFYGPYQPNTRIQDMEMPVYRSIAGWPTDEEYAHVQSPYLIENLGVMHDMHLPLTAKLLVSLQGAPLNDENIRVLVLLFGVEGLTGFTRGYAPEAHTQQFATDPKNGTLGFIPYLEANWDAFIKWAYNSGSIPNYEEHVARLHSIMTGNSAGGAKVTVTIPSPIVHTSLRAQSSTPNQIRFTGTSKRMIFMAKGAALLTKEALSKPYKAEFDEEGRYVPGSAATCGTREVPAGRHPRAIMMMTIEKYIGESAFGLLLMEWQQDVMKDFTVAESYGVVPIDHSSCAKASGEPDLMLDDDDFTAFDAYQKENTRKPSRIAVRKAFNETPLAGVKWGPFRDFIEPVEIMWGPGIEYEADYVSKARADVRVNTVNLLPSGRFITFNQNNIINLSNDDHFQAEFRKTTLPKVMKLDQRSLQGDDAQCIWKLGAGYNAVRLQEFLDLKKRVADDNELDLNTGKTNARRYMGEYLKVRFLYGYHIPLLHVQLIGAERVSPALFPTNLMRGEIAKHAVIVGRGYDHTFVHIFGLHMFNLRRGIRHEDPRGRAWYYLPYASIWTPGTLNGGGQHPCTLMGASKDSVLAYDLFANPSPEYRQLFEKVKLAAGILTTKRNRSLRDHVARSVASGRIEPKDSFSAGVDLINATLLPDRVRISEQLRHKFPKDLRRAYTNMAYNTLYEDVFGDTQNVTLDERAKVMSVVAYMAAEDAGELSNLDDYQWINKSFRFEDGPEVERYTDACNTPIFRGNIREATLRYGSVASKSVRETGVSDMLRPLKRDKYWPRNYSDAQLISRLMQPDLLTNFPHMVEYLQLCGASSEAANQTALNVTQKAEAYVLTDASVNFSLKGSDLTHGFKLDLEGLRHVVDNSSFEHNNIHHNIISTIAFYHSFVHGICTGSFKRKTVIPASDAIYQIRKHLFKGIKNVEGEQFVHLYKEQDWMLLTQD
jgi:hypothetical protein